MRGRRLSCGLRSGLFRFSCDAPTSKRSPFRFAVLVAEKLLGLRELLAQGREELVPGLLELLHAFGLQALPDFGQVDPGVGERGEDLEGLAGPPAQLVAGVLAVVNRRGAGGLRHRVAVVGAPERGSG